MENINNAITKLGTELDRITMRGMKEAVTEYLSQCCYVNPDFIKHILDKDKNLNDCIKYINKEARNYLKDSAEAFKSDGVFGGDVPDELCFKWAEFYFETPEDMLNPKPVSNKNTNLKSETKKVNEIEKESTESQVSLFGSTDVKGEVANDNK